MYFTCAYVRIGSRIGTFVFDSEISRLKKQMSLLCRKKYVRVKIFLKKYENKPIMTKACHRFDTNKVHYCIRSSGVPVSDEVNPESGVTS